MYKLQQHTQRIPFPLRLHNKLAMEIILSTAFGRAVDVQGGKGGKLYEAALEVIAGFSSGQDNRMSLTKVLQFLTCENQA